MSTGASRSGQSNSVTSVVRLALRGSRGGSPEDQSPPPSVPIGGPPVLAPPQAPTASAPKPSFEAIYEEHFDFVWRTARRLGVPENATDDVVQDTFLVLHRRLAEYDGVTPMKRWLMGMTARVVADHRRRWRRKEAQCVPHPAESERALPAHGPAPSTKVEQAEAVQLLGALLDELDDDKREVLILVELEEMTVPEVAEHLGANVNTIYTRLRSARRDFDAAYARHRARTAIPRVGRREGGAP